MIHHPAHFNILFKNHFIHISIGFCIQKCNVMGPGAKNGHMTACKRKAKVGEAVPITCDGVLVPVLFNLKRATAHGAAICISYVGKAIYFIHVFV